MSESGSFIWVVSGFGPFIRVVSESGPFIMVVPESVPFIKAVSIGNQTTFWNYLGAIIIF